MLFLFIYPILGKAQLMDVFQNKEYYTSTYVLKAELAKEYAPSILEIYQDKNNNVDNNWKDIEQQLYNMALKQVENEVSFFQLHTKARKRLKHIEDVERIRDSDFVTKVQNLTLNKVEIHMEAVLNAIGVFYIQYNFDDIHIREYYLADFPHTKIIKIGNTPNSRQQEVLKNLTLSRFTALYLLQTQKLDLENTDRIRSTQKGTGNAPDFSKDFDYSEAIVYPYFSGIMVEFPENAMDSKIFDNHAFRLLLMGSELTELLKVYPEFKSTFITAVQRPSKMVVKALNDDSNFDLSRFKTAPKEFELVESINWINSGQKIFSLNITNYQTNDTVKNLIGSKKIFLNKNNKVLRIEERNDKNIIVGEIKYNYDTKNELTEINFSGSRKRLKLFYYRDDLLNYTQDIDIEEINTSNRKKYIDLNVSNQYFTYNDKYRYTLSFNLVGDLDRNKILQSRYIDNDQFCANKTCLLTNEKGKVVAVINKKGSPIDIRVNARNQPVESYFDFDRDHYIFSYDDKFRIKTFSSYSGQSINAVTKYEYPQNQDGVISLYSSPNNLLQEYEIAFWQD